MDNKLCTDMGNKLRNFLLMWVWVYGARYFGMKKGLRNTEGLNIHDGGDEGDRTPDLLTASQALSQLSYAPVRRSTIRELGRRCKEIFGKFRSRGAGRHPPNGRLAGAGPITGADRAHAHPAISKPCRFTGPGREPTSMPSSAKLKPQVADLRIP